VLAVGLLTTIVAEGSPGEKPEDLRAAARVVAKNARAGDAVAYVANTSEGRPDRPTSHLEARERGGPDDLAA